MIIADDSATRAWVRMPASTPRISRSRPSSRPTKAASPSRRASSSIEVTSSGFERSMAFPFGHKKPAPECSGTGLQRRKGSGGFALELALARRLHFRLVAGAAFDRLRLTVADVDLARLHRLRDLAD